MARPKKTDTEDTLTAAEKKAAEAAEKKAAAIKEPNWDYYDVAFKLRTPMLATCTEASIMATHVLKKAQKEIKKANKMTGQITKIAEQWRGAEFTDDKLVLELQGIITHFAELSGQQIEDFPKDKDELLQLAQEVEENYRNILTKSEQKANVFMKTEKKDGGVWPIISSHMVLGNLKANAKVITNSGDKCIFPSKVSIGESLSLDVKAIESFMVPSEDVDRHPNGDIILYERPIRFNRMGKEETAIAITEQLPINTEFGCTLRVRRKSVITEDALRKLFDLGKNQGFGAWRGSGNMGSYSFKLKKLTKFTEPVIEGHEGWD